MYLFVLFYLENLYLLKQCLAYILRQYLMRGSPGNLYDTCKFATYIYILGSLQFGTNLTRFEMRARDLLYTNDNCDNEYNEYNTGTQR
jgi:hypothetical protein